MRYVIAAIAALILIAAVYAVYNVGLMLRPPM